ncbi:metallophosphoesterase [Mycoplasma marinum]|uniref:Phosphoesterase n=1 Tax=Mycoplasma marinum TaxID=1937190 RepID=A0A4V2NIA9_9MOLU|nr:metallophosphoesterase [Mycoplasma marinum]TCG11618.1 YfcE family phosphodiesterase [Mycoplasma marinum]
MKKILAISDNHGNKKIVDKILSIEEYDLAIHLGDSEFDSKWANSRFDYAVEGNNDFNGLPLEIKFTFEGLNFLIMHGHTRGIYVHNWDNLPIKIAKQENIDVLIHGHSHIPYIIEKQGVFTSCPGSTTIPRTSDGPTYSVYTIKNRKIYGEIKSIPML